MAATAVSASSELTFIRRRHVGNMKELQVRCRWRVRDRAARTGGAFGLMCLWVYLQCEEDG